MTPEQRALLADLTAYHGDWRDGILDDAQQAAIRAALAEVDALRDTLATSSNLNRQHVERIGVLQAEVETLSKDRFAEQLRAEKAEADLATAREALEAILCTNGHVTYEQQIAEAALAKMGGGK